MNRCQHVYRESTRPGVRRVGLILGVAVTVMLGAAALASDEAKSKTPVAPAAGNHWSFQPLRPVAALGSEASIDYFVRRKLREAKLAPSREADRATLVRRVAFVLTGLPPTPEEIAAFVADKSSGAYERMVERYLNSPRHGERWGKHWLDAAGYADSNGYFNADTDRPLAYRYRDYVIRSVNRDKPFDQFVREQIAGDELSGWKRGEPATPEIIELLEATHYLRNGQDGSGESDGNPDEVRTDRYYALESAMQIIGSSLLGVTMQCAKCHDHKFEPLTIKDYYALQAVLYPAFNIDKWVKPNDRVVHANLPGELETWQAAEKKLDAELAELKSQFKTWQATNQPGGWRLFSDGFNDGEPLTKRWSNTAPTDDAPAGSPAVTLDSDKAPAARVKDGALEIIEGGGSGDRWLSTKDAFEWRPGAVGQWIQVTFDLVATKIDGKGGSAERIGYVIAARDFNDNGDTDRGNILIDGNPGGATSVHVDYPGADSKSRGSIGETGYKSGHNYGVRITRTATNEFTLEHLVDGAVDGASLKLKERDLPEGGFAFEYCCGRSFVVDNVIIEGSNDSEPGWVAKNERFQKELAERKKAFDKATKAVAAKRSPKPGRIAWVSDGSAEAPEVRLLKRGNHKTPGDVVTPSFPAFLKTRDGRVANFQPAKTTATTGRRLAWANWLTEANSPQASLLARVTVNRVWQHYFGVGIVATPDNLGLSGAKPSHPELLDWLASKFIESGWSMKALHRLILESATFRQTSAPRSRAVERDPDNHLLWRYPVRRLDAEAIRDAMLAVSGRLSSKTNGPYVPTPRNGIGEVLVDEAKPDAFARSIFVQHRRTQVPTFLGTFDAPSVVFNCTRRAETTMPLQSLSLLNSEFSVKRGEDLAQRLARDCGTDEVAKIRRGFLLTTGREPDSAERKMATRFLAEQRRVYADRKDADARAWADFCQSLFGLNSFLYLE
ncbi:MAG: DUF1553 domain-containing protein [Verrucomicrobia bacterium]|nr:DUF1553 domain-containing protein [Verrucomicrobiota bacterium]